MTQLEHDLKKYMSEDLGMADACDLLRGQFVRRIKTGKGYVMTIGDIRKFLERKIDPQKIMGVVYQLQTCRDIKEQDPTEGPGRPTKRYSWMKGTTK